MKPNREKIMDKREAEGRYIPYGIPKILFEDTLIKKYPHDIHSNEDHRGYFLHGPSGIGKSYRAACLMNDIGKSRNMKGYWANVPRLLEDIRRGFQNPTDRSIIDDYSLVNLLCLDDLGTEHNTSWVMQTLYLIINSRYENMLTTIITSNLSLSELAEKMEDDRLTSRIAGMCSIIEVNGEDKR